MKLTSRNGWLISIPFGVIILTASLHVWSQSETNTARRHYEITESLQFEVPPNTETLRLWFPRPVSDQNQTIQLVDVMAPWPHETTRDPDFGNSILFMEARSPKTRSVDIEVRYRASRQERKGAAGSGQAVPAIFRESRGLVVVNEEIRQIARETAGELTDTTEKARALYNYVLSRMDYDKTGEGWGRGDVLYACAVGKGNCTDFHSLFIALSRAEGIPARFRMGYPVPKGPAGTISAAYHCWAEFHVETKGWIPVDISEAWKDSKNAEYYFGNLDKDRIGISIGREISLSPRQADRPLNFLSRPYIEIDGIGYYDFKLQRTFKERRET